MDIQTSSKQKIIQGVLNLVSSKRLCNIKVSDITAASDVSHQTFYRVFMDKYDACEHACKHLLGSAVLFVGADSSIKDHTICVLNIIKSHKGFFKHLLCEKEGEDILRRALSKLSASYLNLQSRPPITNTWVFILGEWIKSDFSEPAENVYIRMLSCYPVGDVIFGQELLDVLDKYGKLTIQELHELVNSNNSPKEAQ